ncbi:hypothetical protein ABB37_07600 [Leptomonas pyrrhocoris]|uniref:Transmembrane protein n=1 Tax=Leptomonas pyrrhocoris TaxID=157538 RepID=A0A0M9FV88_LEPPY|nr:hypothetical protein ABB37_07600 [Leptomonas pyrrhocoris]XP_015655220.1 hypothetical protein ABB37_07600 [Leptomonas pyrrhocoris]KPA76780.1 hypothetical protein ABB37_07600 [Leptomonas pyrrhocoris]KPA76781.1 hypothetical protein ABB37_07600 [Leptomonas pyrrhocoris]|eukprot:XP_015655219.1 hypothetical protein ABB37_07600 [Leptomonas pyrrhocoris]
MRGRLNRTHVTSRRVDTHAAEREDPFPRLLQRNLNTSIPFKVHFSTAINMNHEAEAPHASADATSIIVVDKAPRENSLADFFSFNSPGGLTWWAGAILGVLGCCAFASMIVIHTESNRRAAPAVMSLLRAQQCPLLSSLLPPLAFHAWRTTCTRVPRGSSYPCTALSDCIALGSRCADAKLLAQLQCVSTREGADNKKVCAYPSVNSTPMLPPSTAASPGFCTSAGTTCALCLDGTCESTTPSAGSIGCPSSSACAGDSWLCNPLRL